MISPLRQTLFNLKLVILVATIALIYQPVNGQLTVPAPAVPAPGGNSPPATPPAAGSGGANSPLPAPGSSTSPSSPAAPAPATGGDNDRTSPVGNLPPLDNNGAPIPRVVTSIAPARTVRAGSPNPTGLPGSGETDNTASSGAGANGTQDSNSSAKSSSSSSSSSSSNGPSPFLIGGIVVGVLLCLCIGLAIYSRWNRRERRNRRFEEFQFGHDEPAYTPNPHPFSHRTNPDPFKQDLGAHHRGIYP